jgi:hypothetical protein
VRCSICEGGEIEGRLTVIKGKRVVDEFLLGRLEARIVCGGCDFEILDKLFEMFWVVASASVEIVLHDCFGWRLWERLHGKPDGLGGIKVKRGS